MLGKMSFMSEWIGGELTITGQKRNPGADKRVKFLTKGCCKCKKFCMSPEGPAGQGVGKTNLLGDTI